MYRINKNLVLYTLNEVFLSDTFIVQGLYMKLQKL